MMVIKFEQFKARNVQINDSIENFRINLYFSTRKTFDEISVILTKIVFLINPKDKDYWVKFSSFQKYSKHKKDGISSCELFRQGNKIVQTVNRWFINSE